MPLSQLPAFPSACFDDLSAALDQRSAARLFRLFLGALFAKGRRTVTSWFRAAGITTDFRHAYNSLWAAGHHAEALAYRLLCIALKPLMRRAAGDYLLFAIDDTPTAGWTSPLWPSVIRGRLPPSWNWPSNWFVLSPCVCSIWPHECEIFTESTIGKALTEDEGAGQRKNRFVDSWLGDVPIPLPRNYLLGIEVQKQDFENGYRSYLRGEWQQGGWW